MKAVKDFLNKRKEKAAARKAQLDAKMSADGPKRIKQIRGAYTGADSAFGKINDARSKRERDLEELTSGR